MHRSQTQNQPTAAEHWRAAGGGEWKEHRTNESPFLEAQHGEALGFLNLLEAAIHDSSVIRVCYVLEQLSNHMQKVFADEERRMRLQGYTELGGHLLEHRQFTNRIYQLRRAYLDRNIQLEGVAVLKDWLAQHASQSDRRYLSWLADSHDGLSS